MSSVFVIVRLSRTTASSFGTWVDLRGAEGIFCLNEAIQPYLLFFLVTDDDFFNEPFSYVKFPVAIAISIRRDGEKQDSRRIPKSMVDTDVAFPITWDSKWAYNMYVSSKVGVYLSFECIKTPLD